ncbi:MAG TPA: hypothetical protein VN758_09000 [Solirubrobacterales bacterium]|nr:hypothetical protein [Solirubrobacterales bacterium]
MKSKTRDKSGGALDKARGRAREAAAALKGNPEGKAKGRARQAKGQARKKKGHLRDLFKD